MRKLIVAGLAVATVLSVSVSSASAQSVVGVGLGGGLAIPTGDLGDVAKTGWSAGAGLFIIPNGGQLGFRIDGGYTRFTEDGGDGTAKFMTGMGNLMYAIATEGNIRPYLVAGAGILNSKFDDNDSESALAFQGGAGITVGTGNTRVFVEGKYFTSSKDDVTTSYMPIIAGVSIRFR